MKTRKPISDNRQRREEREAAYQKWFLRFCQRTGTDPREIEERENGTKKPVK